SGCEERGGGGWGVLVVGGGGGVGLSALWGDGSRILKNVVATAVVTLFFVDAASFGFFYEWNALPPDLAERLADPPTVKYIKERESDLNSFRILSHGSSMYTRNYEMFNSPNISIPRGLQSVNGYDPVFLSRYGVLAGGMDMAGAGIVQEKKAFGPDDQSFNLLNVKYLLFERSDSMNDGPSIERDG